MRIGVVGYSEQKFNEDKAVSLLKKAFDKIEKDVKSDEDIWVISGLTWLGIPGSAYEEAAKRGWKTMGIACEKAKEHKCYPVDEEIIIGKEWGDESKTFLDSFEILVRIGGGKQSLKETEETKKKDIPVIEYELDAE